MKLPNYIKDIYLRWRTQKKHTKHIYIRTPHARVLKRKTKEFQIKLREQTENETAAFTASNLIELMIQRCFQEEPEIKRHVIRELQILEDIKHEQ